MILLMLAAVATAALALAARRRHGDLPERIAVAVTHRLPADRRPWGRALVAELAAIPDRGQRWRFAAAVLRIAAFPPARKPATVRATTAVAAVLTLVATLVAVKFVPTLSVFVAALGLLTSGYATAVACRRPPVPIGRAQLAAAGMTVAAVLAAVGAVVAIAIHPAATRDQTHIFSIVLAAALCGYLIAGLSARPASGHGRATLWAAVTASLAVAASTVLQPAEALSAPISPIIAAATLATSLAAGAATGSRTAANRAGLLAAALGTPIHFATGLLMAQFTRPAVLTDSYDIAAYPHSGYRTWRATCSATRSRATSSASWSPPGHVRHRSRRCRRSATPAPRLTAAHTRGRPVLGFGELASCSKPWTVACTG